MPLHFSLSSETESSAKKVCKRHDKQDICSQYLIISIEYSHSKSKSGFGSPQSDHHCAALPICCSLCPSVHAVQLPGAAPVWKLQGSLRALPHNQDLDLHLSEKYETPLANPSAFEVGAPYQHQPCQPFQSRSCPYRVGPLSQSEEQGMPTLSGHQAKTSHSWIPSECLSFWLSFVFLYLGDQMSSLPHCQSLASFPWQVLDPKTNRDQMWPLHRSSFRPWFLLFLLSFSSLFLSFFRFPFSSFSVSGPKPKFVSAKPSAGNSSSGFVVSPKFSALGKSGVGGTGCTEFISCPKLRSASTIRWEQKEKQEQGDNELKYEFLWISENQFWANDDSFIF